MLLIDDNSISWFTDDLGNQCFVDDLGNFTFCPLAALGTGGGVGFSSVEW